MSLQGQMHGNLTSALKKREEGKRETETEREAMSQSNSVPLPSVTITAVPKRPGLERPLQLMSTGER